MQTKICLAGQQVRLGTARLLSVMFRVLRMRMRVVMFVLRPTGPSVARVEVGFVDANQQRRNGHTRPEAAQQTPLQNLRHRLLISRIIAPHHVPTKYIQIIQ